MSTEKKRGGIIWQFQGFDDGVIIDKADIWRDLSFHRSAACEAAFQSNLDKTSTNGGEYQFDLTNMEMFVIDFAFSCGKIPIRRTTQDL